MLKHQRKDWHPALVARSVPGQRRWLSAAQVLFAGIAGAVSVFLLSSAALKTAPVVLAMSNASPAASITVDYPLNGSLFPPEITSPTFLWHDPDPSAKRWTIEIVFGDHSNSMRVEAAGELMRPGKIDPQAGPGIELTAEQASAHTWKPDAETWAKIKTRSVRAPARLIFTGFGESSLPVSKGEVSISTSKDPVGAPVFYRDVPLRTSSGVDRGPIAPLPPDAIPLIKWRVRNFAEPESHVVMENLPTCANCHSFSRDGKTFGLDMDGPRNDKGLYALVPVAKDMTIRNQDMIHWSSFDLNSEASKIKTAVKRFGFMSQVSPDGRYVVTSIGPPDNADNNRDKVPGFASGLLDRLYSTNYKDFRFLQVFYPTRGVLAFYDRKEGTARMLPGADDPQFVQTSAFWSPDGKYLIFSRARARDPYPAGAPKPLYANDPNETQIQYDLYKIPFNEGRGGTAVPLEGASNNGMSNDFPKVSPDGKWIVFVQNKNGLLMRPDSRLFMVPFTGGKARLMNCNTPLMNSWHSFSPNGRWLVFSSKARSPYTQLMLTHIDADGNDTPSILVENTTAANRAVNIPEFVNVAPDGLDKIDPEATQFYKLIDQAYDLMQSNKVPESIAVLRHAIELDSTDSMAHFNLATMLAGTGQQSEALPEFRKACELTPENPLFLQNFAVSLALNGNMDGAIAQMTKAVELQPASPEMRFNLGYLMGSHGDYAGAIEPLQKAVELSKGTNERFLTELAQAYAKTGHPAEAAQVERKALDLAVQSHDDLLERTLRDTLAEYERSTHDATPQ